MDRTIDYYFTLISPWVYLGHRAFMVMATRHGLTVQFRPVALAKVWAQSGSVPLGQRSPMRQRQRLVELQRYARYRRLKLNLKPAFFPANPATADLAAAAIVILRGDPAAFVQACGEAVWANDLDIADPKVVERLLAEAGHEPAAVRAVVDDGRAAAAVEANSAAASAADAIGVPTYVWRGETFWGQDRLDMLEEMVASGRPAFTVA